MSDSISSNLPFLYSIDGGSVTITQYTGTSIEPVIPDEIEAKPVTAIGERAFSGKPIISVTGGQFVTEIGAGTFYLCRSLLSVPLSDHLISIGDNAFGLCDALTTVELPDSVASIGCECFAQCNALFSVDIGSGLKSIGCQAFYNNRALRAFSVSEDNAVFSSVDGVLFDQQTAELVQYPLGRQDKEYQVPEGVRSIRAYAFAWAGVRHITLPDSMVSIGDYAFAHSTIRNIYFGKNLRTIGKDAMKYCHMLQDVTFPAGLTEI
ncbi:MAG: leucine-rich repeat domain-containing protein [Oscillospiraceae bacterium]|nr:leucine-rich repeat domain-containing protein [Oscillospiraceae bacterium]